MGSEKVFVKWAEKVFVNRPTGSGTQLVVSNIRLFSRVHSPRARCEESVLSGYRDSGDATFPFVNGVVADPNGQRLPDPLVSPKCPQVSPRH